MHEMCSRSGDQEIFSKLKGIHSKGIICWETLVPSQWLCQPARSNRKIQIKGLRIFHACTQAGSFQSL